MRKFKIIMIVKDYEADIETLAEIKNIYQNEVFNNELDINFNIESIEEIKD